MKRLNKVLSVVLALIMIVPMFSALMPLEADAASTAHKTFDNLIDFEDATTGVLTADYVQGKLARGFSATTSASGVIKSDLRKASLWTVAEEQKYVQTAGADTEDTADDVYGFVSAGNGNQVIRQTTAGSFPMFTLWDDTGILWDQPFEYSFDIFARNMSSGGSTGLIHFATSSAFNNGSTFADGKRINLLGFINGKDNSTPITNGTQSVTYGQMPIGQWASVRICVYPDTGRLIVFINDKQVSDSILTGVKDLYDMGDPTTAGLAIGWNYGQPFDFDLDNISLRSLAETEDIREHIDFSDARLEASTEIQTLSQYLTENDGSSTVSLHNAATSVENYSLKQDETDGWVLYQNTPASSSEVERGITFKDATNLSGDETVTIQFDFKKNSGSLANAYNAIRFYDGVKGTSKVAPLSFRKGNYITTGANGYAALRLTDEGYVQPAMQKGVWYSFKAEVDLANATFQVWMNEGRVTDANGDLVWEPLYYITDTVTVSATKVSDGSTASVAVNPMVGGTTIAGYVFDATSFSQYVTTKASFASYGAIAPTAAPTMYMMFGTSNAWQETSNEAYMDNLSIKTADGGINISMDFEPEIKNYPVNTDWWENESFVNANAKKGGAKLSDWQVVNVTGTTPALLQEVFETDENGEFVKDENGNKIFKEAAEKVDEDGNPITVDIDPQGEHSMVLKPKEKLGSFCFNDTNNVLSSYVFDVSYDFFMVAQPSSNIHLLKLWAPYTATDGGADATLSTLVLYNGEFMIYHPKHPNQSGDRIHADIKTYASVGQWYNIRVRFDFLSGYYRAYVNGRLIHTQNILEVYPDMDLNELQSLHVALHNHYGSSVRAYHYLDNIRVESVDAAKRNASDFSEYQILGADFEDESWLTSAKAGEIANLTFNYTKSSIIENADYVGNHALCLTGTSGGSMTVDMLAMGGYHDTFAAELSLSYGNVHGSALDVAVISDKNLANANKVLLSVMGDNANETLAGTMFFNYNGNRYYLCDSDGKMLHVDEGNAEAASLTDIAIIVNAADNTYAVYVNRAPAYYRLNGNVGASVRANAIPLEMTEGKAGFSDPVLSLAKCSGDNGTVNKLIVDDVRISSVKNGLVPVLVGHQNSASGTSIRLLATVDMLYYDSMGFIVEANGVTKRFETTAVYSSIEAGGETVVAKELDGRYITALIITDIDETVTFTVTPFVSYFGAEIRGETQTVQYTAE